MTTGASLPGKSGAVCRDCSGTGLRVPNSVKEAVDKRVPYYGPGARSIPCECGA